MKRIMMITLIMLGVFGLATGIAFAATSDSFLVSATVATGTSTLDVTEATMAFGTLTGTPAAHRFATAAGFTVNYYAANSPWTIRVYSNNHPGVDLVEGAFAGLKGADTTTYVPLKVWCPNYGGTGTPPDPKVDLNWIGTAPTYADARWLRIPELDEQTTVPTTWRRLAYTGAELATGFANFLGVDVEGVKAQAYTTTLTVEIINQ